MYGHKWFRLMFLLSLAFSVLFSGVPARADSARLTKGDVEGLFNSWHTGARALRLNSSSLVAAPVQGFEKGIIVPFFTDGYHYCVEDWHLIVLAWLNGGDKSYTYQQAVVDLASIHTFILDGQTLDITQTPVERRVAPSIFEEEYGFAVGRVMSPQDIAVGKHTLSYKAAFADGQLAKDRIVFYMEPAGSPACTQ